MKILLVNGSPRAKGNTATVLEEVGKVLRQEGLKHPCSSWETAPCGTASPAAAAPERTAAYLTMTWSIA